jgi:hypothetical protein
VADLILFQPVAELQACPFEIGLTTLPRGKAACAGLMSTVPPDHGLSQINQLSVKGLLKVSKTFFGTILYVNG